MDLSALYDKIFKYCFFKVKNAHLAEDITQETFLRFFTQHKYVSRGKPLAYLYTLARNLCIDHFRKKTTEPLSDGDTPAPSPYEAVETSVALQTALAALPEDMQEIILLRYANDLTLGEVAAFTGLSRFALHRKIKFALATLKTALKKEDFA
ncbi:MAG: RNA polymerase sigma factor [Defluviitaleaceae bacterium]|nr:RNA polymerase sigma factor [Defluviitaleaceae bacterium]MCL2276084.1 RNA polymerase sigma factor [Defluviitaleaceae bacterium]